MSLAGEAPPEAPADTEPGPSVPDGVPLTIGYHGPYVIQPGLRVGAFFQVQSRAVQLRPRKDGTPRARTEGLFAAPHLAVFGRPNNHWSVLVDGEVGWRGLRHGSNLYSAVALGLGYILELQTETIAVDLGSGDQSRSRTDRHYFLPTLNYEFGQEFREHVGWYAQLSAGYRVGSVPGTVYFALGLGLRVRIPTRQAGRARS